MTKETDLYHPVKSLLEAKGYEVKAEVKGCDVVGVKEGSPVVIIELKLLFSLELVLQGINRQNMTDDVYMAVLAPDTALKRKNWRARQRGYVKLCRQLGLGLMTVAPEPLPQGVVSVLLDPKPYAPRKSNARKTRLVAEFQRRKGDPNTGGTNRTKIMTAYRQDALRCAQALVTEKAMKVADIRKAAAVQNAASILQKNHYGWFERTARGIYCLTSAGHESLAANKEVLLISRDQRQDKK
ncbi:DUF2161 family putative PD-(D/E)XK-type phosphodiesterase [Sneathiella marina]|uniref:DUF2161 family putative PD-(D/E)XK-type phosphodiesterase n=1 Tax=Sneathiella marina TaxID=2950108 RepID=A0ABY4W582_9PROT|nr:DUF2161 family putative PD-(D/E)XK-type phosphodiesterase [Sneathiella marina]USG61979.1 DUF2161 family putative PD-(D/E)XK-type phosphodiesterase [Sneathiella marina]